MKINEIIEKLGISIDDVIGDMNKTIEGVASLSKAVKNQLTFCKVGNESKLSNKKKCIIIVPKTFNLSTLPKDNTYPNNPIRKNSYKYWENFQRF